MSRQAVFGHRRAERFADAAAFRRVNTASHWVIPKPRFPKAMGPWPVMALTAMVLAACEGGDFADLGFGEWLFILGGAAVVRSICID